MPKNGGISFLWLFTSFLTCTDGLLLSEVQTPCVVLDTRPLVGDSDLPTLKTETTNWLVQKSSIADGHTADGHKIVSVCECHEINSAFLHTSVVQTKLQDSLASVDLHTGFPAGSYPEGHLVLGLNNHHVGSYYWARSAGSGSAMEAPGVQLSYSASEDSCFLKWENDEGFTECNSNDGKRSEWVAFLRPGDTVQLLPSLSTLERVLDKGCWRVYGISSKGRPLGSEPAVVCEWKLETSNIES